MGNAFKVVLRHFVAAAVGGAAGIVTAKTGVALGPETTEPVIAAATIGVYGAVNHAIKFISARAKR